MTGAIKLLNEMVKAEHLKSLEGNPRADMFAMLYEKHSDTSTAGLTKAVVKWLELHNAQVERVENKGGIIPGKVVGVGFYGVKRTANKRIYSPNKNGTADVHSVINGRAVKWEIKCKYTKDRVRPKQLEYAESVRKAGGLYFIVTDFDNFITHWEGIKG